jgi:predicted glycosyltransferase involved in capsule biosynthesis
LKKDYADFDWNKVKTVEDIKNFLQAIHPRVQVDKSSKEYDLLAHLCNHMSDKGYEVGDLKDIPKRNYHYTNTDNPIDFPTRPKGK